MPGLGRGYCKDGDPFALSVVDTSDMSGCPDTDVCIVCLARSIALALDDVLVGAHCLRAEAMGRGAKSSESFSESCA